MMGTVLRIDFPGGTGEDVLEHISWDDWFQKFDENNLCFLYQEEKQSGEEVLQADLARQRILRYSAAARPGAVSAVSGWAAALPVTRSNVGKRCSYGLARPARMQRASSSAYGPTTRAPSIVRFPTRYARLSGRRFGLSRQSGRPPSALLHRPRRRARVAPARPPRPSSSSGSPTLLYRPCARCRYDDDTTRQRVPLPSKPAGQTTASLPESRPPPAHVATDHPEAAGAQHCPC